ncbi:OadG family protein [Eubacterium barkeri]|uniref:Oxaloacetate decarboxylase, gamma chain n=1 Tax=Eubacterium barkeri TaxID=1528 RepID=A0A1H3AW93_EUBBA|nr:OadG family protein [Eubacterium barkeri]SDX33661.1 Oxaloacetate decarboxylase, gamma chain [Eubacterium barkeri]
MSNTFVVLMGIGTVFVGLICIVFLCTAMSAVIRALEGKGRKTGAPAGAVAAPGPVAPIPKRGELVAAISAALAEELGMDIPGFRIVSLKRLSPGGDPPRGELVAAISAALAEEIGTDVSGLRITSLEKVS